MILSSGISLWMGLRSWMSLQVLALPPEGSGPAHPGTTRCRHAVRLLRELRADLQRQHHTAEDTTRINTDHNTRQADQVTFSRGCDIYCFISRVQVKFPDNDTFFGLFHILGEAFSPYRQGQYMKKRRLDT